MKTYTHEPTSNPKLFRVVDRKGDWAHYFDAETNTYLRAVSLILSMGYAKPELLEYAKNHTREEIEATLAAAGDRGDSIHQLIRMALSGVAVDRRTLVLAENNRDSRDMTDDEWDGYLSFTRFWIAHNPQLVAFEETVKNEADGYAGTFDVMFIIRQSCGAKCCNCAKFLGKLVLADWKSSGFGKYGGIYNSFGPQVASYGVADLRRFIGKRTIEGTAIVRLGTAHRSTGGYECEFYDLEESTTHWKEFLAAKTIADSSYKPFDPAKEIVDIPETAPIIVERIDLSEPVKKSRKSPSKKTRIRKVAKSTKQAA